jgi:hypothetical protein
MRCRSVLEVGRQYQQQPDDRHGGADDGEPHNRFGMRDARDQRAFEPVLEPEQANDQGYQTGAAERKQNAQAHQLRRDGEAVSTVKCRDIVCIVLLVTRVDWAK